MNDVLEIRDLMAKLDISLRQLREYGIELAESERNYKVKLAQKVLEMKDKKMAATLISLVVYGDKEVSKCRFLRDTAEVMYKTNLEMINGLKLQLRIAENQLSREWGATK